MSTTKTVTAPPLSWKSPRDTGNQVSGDAQRNIRYGYLSSIGTKDKQEVCRSRGTHQKMRSLSNNSSGTPSFLRQPAQPVEAPAMPPSSKEPRQQQQSLLNEELIERTRYIVVYISLSLKELGCGGEEWARIARTYWGVAEESAEQLPGPATVSGANTAVSELIQILLVEGALLFGRAEFDNMDRVRKLVEACMIVQKGLQQIQDSVSV